MPPVGLVVLEAVVERTMVAHNPVVLERLIRGMLVDQVLPTSVVVVVEQQQLGRMPLPVVVTVDTGLIILLQARL